MTEAQLANRHPDPSEGREITHSEVNLYAPHRAISFSRAAAGEKRRYWLLYRDVSTDAPVQRAYENMRSSGESHNLSEMLALRTFPGVHGTDSTFMAGTHAQDTPYDNWRYQAAKEAGVDTNGKRYLSGLARFPNDPSAWVSDSSDVKRICEERGWNCHGLVEVEAPKDIAPTPDVAIAPEIVQDHVEDCLSAYPEGDRTLQLRADIEEAVTKELSGEIDLDESPHVDEYSYDDSVRWSEG